MEFTSCNFSLLLSNTLTGFRSRVRCSFTWQLRDVVVEPKCLFHWNQIVCLNPFMSKSVINNRQTTSFHIFSACFSSYSIAFHIQLEYKRMLVGLLVHLLSCGHVLPVIRTMHRLFTRNRVDVSIARHFVTEVSSMRHSLFIIRWRFITTKRHYFWIFLTFSFCSILFVDFLGPLRSVDSELDLQ